VDLLGDWRRGGPAADRLAATVRTLILDGRLPLSDRLPAERTLAAAIGVSRTTVTTAYDRLRADGYLESRQGAGSWATVPATAGPALDERAAAEIDLTIAALAAPAMLPELVARAVAQLPRWLDHHGYAPMGLAPLRAAIAARYTARGLLTSAEQILVTSGAMQAVNLAVKALLPRGATAVVEIPSYPAALSAIRAAGARTRSVPVSGQGWDLETLAAVTERDAPALAYLIPDFHNPTGARMDEQTRGHALSILKRTHVLADETFVDMDLDGGEQPPPLAACGPSERVLTIGSLSKSVWGGIRVGWIRAAPPIVRRLANDRATVDLASPVVEQLIAVEMLGELDAILVERRALARQQRDSLRQALSEHLPHWRPSPAHGGLCMWLELPRPISTSLVVLAREHGVALTPGPRFGSDGLLERFLRLPFTARPAELDHAVRLLAELEPRASGQADGVSALSPYTA
jgi:DNA-binding transcriptional MocR family regulator